MSANTWIVVAGDPAIGALIETARALGGQVTAAVVGPRAVADMIAAGGVDKVVWFGDPDQAPVEAYASAVADAVGAAPGVVLAASRPGDRVLLGAVAARLPSKPCRSPDPWLSSWTAGQCLPRAARHPWKRWLPPRWG